MQVFSVSLLHNSSMQTMDDCAIALVASRLLQSFLVQHLYNQFHSQ